MFSNGLIAFLIAAGLGTWIYTKMLRQTGGNTQSALIGALVSAGIIFLVVITLLSMLVKH